MILIRLIFYISILSILLIGYFDYITGDQISMILLYAVPILVSSWYSGTRDGILLAFIAGFIWLIASLANQINGENLTILSWNAFNRLCIFIILAYTVSLQHQLKRSLENEKLRANTDKLTGLLNKEAFRKQVEEEILRAKRYKHAFSLVFFDIDDFKKINDIQGHAQGDKLLQQIGATIMHAIRKIDIAGRVGGDEFSICLPETDEEHASEAINKLIKALDSITSESECKVTASIGAVTCTGIDLNETYDSLLGRADKLMYAAKKKGKNTTEFEIIDVGKNTKPTHKIKLTPTTSSIS